MILEAAPESPLPAHLVSAIHEEREALIHVYAALAGEHIAENASELLDSL